MGGHALFFVATGREGYCSVLDSRYRVEVIVEGGGVKKTGSPATIRDKP
jgi:hypothetical protein